MIQTAVTRAHNKRTSTRVGTFICTVGALVLSSFIGQFVEAGSIAQVKTPTPSAIILRDEALGGVTLADKAKAALVSAGISVEITDAKSIGAKLSSGKYGLFVYTAGRIYPAYAGEAIDSYLRRGGNLLTLGGPPLAQPAWEVDGQWYTKERLGELAQKSLAQRILWDFEADAQSKSWSRSTNATSKERSTVTAGDHGSPSGRSLQVDIKALIGWDTWGKGVRGIPAGHDVVGFYAKGDDRTPQFSVELREKDGSRWIGVANISKDWKYYALRAEDFKYWHDGSAVGRGGAGDKVNLANVNQFIVGLAFTHTMVGDGDHRFWVDEISTMPDPLGGQANTSSSLVIDTVTPEYKLYPVKGPATIKAMSNQALAVQGDYPVSTQLFSCSPRPGGSGIGKERASRFVPLLGAYGGDGNRMGYAAWLMICKSDGAGDYPGAAWTVYSPSDPSFYESPQVAKSLGQTAKRMLEGLWLSEGGSQFYTYFSDAAQVKLGAVVQSKDKLPASSVVEVEVQDLTGKRIFWKKFNPAVLKSQSFQTVWDAKGFPAKDYTVTTRLVVDGRTIDVLRHALSSWRPKPEAKRSYVTRKDGYFWKDGKPWYAHGVNYMPSSGIALEDGPAFEYWLEGKSYDPYIVEEDLTRIKALGMNSVSVFIYNRSVMAMNLLDLLARCERHGLLVNLSMRPHANPLEFEEAEVKEIIDEYRLAQFDIIYAYDLAWERSWGFYEPSYTNTAGRRGYDSDWAAWIVERYGSVEFAESDWQFKCPRTPEGDLTGPSDAQLRVNGSWTRMVAAYRRFVDDFISQRHSLAARAIRTMDPHHLISFRMSGDAGDPTADPAAFGYDFRGLALSMDMMEPEGYGRIGSWDRVRPGVFTAAYSRYAAPGRPLLWAEFGRHAWSGSNFMEPNPQLEEQGAFFQEFYRMTALSKADGTAAWWYPGGFRVGEESDYGVLNPDGSARPVTDAIRQWSPKVAEQQLRPEVDYWITIDRDSDARGLYGIYETVKDEFWKALDAGKWPGLRDAGMGTDSTNTPLVAVGNTKYNGKNPPKYLNAEFAYIEIKNSKGQWEEVSNGASLSVAKGKPVKLRAKVSNTQVAKWVAPSGAGEGCVYLGAYTGPVATGEVTEEVALLPITKATDYLGTAQVEESTLLSSVTGTVALTLQMTAKDRMWFGEKIRVELVAK